MNRVAFAVVLWAGACKSHDATSHPSEAEVTTSTATSAAPSADMDGATESAPSVDDAADSASAAPEVDAAPEASVAVATKEVQVGTGQGLDQRWRPHAMRPPQVRLGTTQVNGRLPPEILQRIVRQHFGQYLECYKQGLRNNPTLVGRVSVKLVIQRDGSVGTAADGGSDLPDQSVVQCVVRHFTNLQFPQPEGGIVTAVFPLIFSPGDP